MPDGGSYEGSITYLSFIIDFFLLYKVICDKLSISTDPAIDNRIEKSCEFVHSMIDRNGNMPNIGDQDSAVLVNFALDNAENFKSILNSGSVLYNRPEFRSVCFPDLKTKILVESEGRSDCGRIERTKSVIQPNC